MRYVRLLTAAVTVAALSLLIAGAASENALFLLSGVMLLWAALVKIVVVVIWRHLGTDRENRVPEGTYQ